MKKGIAALTAAILTILFMLSGCNTTSSDVNNDNKISVVCTAFPQYNWAVNVAGDNAKNIEFTLLTDNGEDMHNYQATADDMVKIASADIFIYVGGPSDEWAGKILSGSTSNDIQIINMMEALGGRVKNEEHIEGMESEEEHGNDTPEKDEADEHIWLSLKNAEIITDKIAEALSQEDNANKDAYKANAESYKKELAALDKEYEDAVKNAKNNTLIFADRFPFRYLTDDYGLKYYAAFPGCSAETEASFETVAFLANKLDELSLDYVFVIENSDKSIAKTVIKNSKSKNAEILELNSIQSVTKENISVASAYLDIMKSNLNVLKKALN